MKRLILCMVLLEFAAIIVRPCLCADQPPNTPIPNSPANLLRNPGFEETADGAATSWRTLNQAKWKESALLDNDTRRSGATSLRLAASPRYISIASNPIPVQPSHVYYISFWRKQEIEPKQEAASYLTILINAGQKPLFWDGQSKQSASCGWTKYVLKYITPQDAKTIQVGLNMDCRSASASFVWFDDIEVLDGNASVPTQPRPTPSETCPLKHGRWQFAPELSDEFDASRIDASKWEIVDGREWGRAFAMMAQNASQKNGALHIRITPGELPGKPNVIYHSAMLKTRQLMRYGYLEIRAKLTACPTRNAFWLYRQDNSGHGWSEIDIFENWGGIKDRGGNQIASTLHVQQLIDPAQWSIPTKRWEAPLRLDQQFHVYGLEWNDTHLVIYFDGSPVIVHDNNNFYYPLNITLNSEPDGPRPPMSELPDEFVVDYLRVWRRTDQEDRRIWLFGFELPKQPKGAVGAGEVAQECRVKTENGGELVFTQRPGKSLLMRYDNPQWFKSQKTGRIEKTIAVTDSRGRIIRFTLRFEDRAHLGLEENSGYQPAAIDIQPDQRQPGGTKEIFVLPTTDGREMLLNVTY